MRKLFFTICLWLTVGWLYAQQQADPVIFTGNAALQERPLEDGNPNGPELYIQVGTPIPYSHTEAAGGASFDIRFPWDVAYIPLTFSEDYFEVSKGYYSEKVKLDWTVQSNGKKIEQIKIYRREFMDYEDSEYVLLATLSSDSYTYEDTDTQGGVLYEYKVEALGVSSIPKRYVTFITGIGYRNPTGVVAGNVSFDGGSPVKDVVVRADPQGGDLAFGSSLLFTSESQLSIPLSNSGLNEAITLQAWVKVGEGSSASLFRLEDVRQPSNLLEVSYIKTPDSFQLTVAHPKEGSKTFILGEYYPNGNLDGQGYDLLDPFMDPDKPQTNFSENFVHISIVLESGKSPLFYLNGRNIDTSYFSTLPAEATAIPEITVLGDYIFQGFQTTDVVVADGLSGNIDEIRLWNKPLKENRIRTDFKRYLGGAEPGLIAYIRCDEKAGDYAYDISKVGVEFNKNHARILKGNWVTDKPTSSQLGILGVTDSLGNYIISAIPFSGAGESYTITPMLGVHQFEPGQQLVFVGNGSEVINKVNFLDISSFDFLGRAYYTTAGIFSPVDTVDNFAYVGEGTYNQHEVIMDGQIQMVSKGKYFYDQPADKLYETPTIHVEGANVFIDGEMVLDKNKRPVVTDKEGFFKIKVPIGEHYIEVKKDKHSFTHGGRFPAARQDSEDLFEFFEHQQATVTFLDTTRVSLVGRIVGGMTEAEKPIGFGFDGPRKETYNAGTDEEKTLDISSVNNIGQATVTLNYMPPGGTTGMEIETSFTTNSETGEYKVDLLPISYTISAQTGISIPSSPSIGPAILESDETVNLTAPQDTVTSHYVNGMEQTISSEPYHFVKSFTYRSAPVLNVVSQSWDLAIKTGILDENGVRQETSISTEGFDYPVYTQGMPYAIVFETYEEYLNKDNADNEPNRVPVVDGEFMITNNLALAGSESLTVDEENPNISKYVFRGGLPSIAPPFTRTLEIRYRVDGVDQDARNYKKEGIILGGRSDGSQTFVTQAPDIPDIILRDPPGSNSFASIEKGESISFTEEGSFSLGGSGSSNLEVKLGVKVAAGGGLAGPFIESESVNGFTTGVAMSLESTDSESITKTYTFNETISTSDDPDFVGSEADLYIGNSKNYYYGLYDNVQADMGTPTDGPSVVLTNDENESAFINKKKAFYFAEEPSETFFIYSQNYVLETLIPELEVIIEGIDQGVIVEETPGVLARKEYVEQIRLWKKVIQDNERTKYRSLAGREQYKEEIKNNLEREVAAIDDHLSTIEALGAAGTIIPGLTQISAVSLIEASNLLKAKKEAIETKLALLESKFVQNVSFDAGLGEYTNSSEISIARQKTKMINVNFDASLDATVGFELSGAGILLHTSHHINSDVNSALTKEETENTIVSYTLKDNDKGNFLSVDVVNTFDGNGPVFSTVGGRTSCPYEGIDTTLFYNQTAYNSEPRENGPFGPVDTGTIYSGGEQISYATQRIEVPGISVKVASVTDVPEERAAEFTLILENNSVAEADANFLLYVENTTNPFNAIINIEQNGTVVHVPYGEKVEYALTLRKSISDVYEYKDIEIVLASLCDGELINERVAVSATFRPSCTSVEIDSPLENWVFNASDAYNPDNTTNPLNISMLGYNRAFSSFESFRLEYRKSTSSTWTRLQTYYNTEELLQEALAAGEDQVTLITENTTYFSWDIGAATLSDGKYELRAVSDCSNGTQFVSDVITGTVDLNVPVQFGTPAPTDGILGAGEDLRLQFSEPILYSPALSKIEVKGETNQQEIDHNVSVHFQGAANTMVIEKPNIMAGDFSIEFWLQMHATGAGTLFTQENGMKVSIENGILSWTHGGKTLAKPIMTDGLFHHYTLTYSEENDRLSIYQDDQEVGSLEIAGIGAVSNSAPLIIGGNSFAGNMHDLRLWSKHLTLSQAYAGQFNELMGTERDLVGYWPMNEGHGTYASDLARHRHALLNAEWDIKPKGTAYDLKDGQYLVLDDVDFVQLTDLMDVTLSFWLKTEQSGSATLLSNGRGNGEDLTQSNGKANKWAVSIEEGILYLASEGNRYKLSTTNLADNSWHHVGLVLRRIGTLKTYIDAAQESSHPVSGIGGLSGNKFWIGARGFVNSAGTETVDDLFTGKIDEMRLWNMARSTEQIDRDRFNEVNFNAIGLMLYAQMNQPDPLTASGPRYYHAAANQTVLPGNAKLSAGAVSYTDDAPKITPERPYLTFEVSHVINGDEIVITPLVSDWSVLEGQILDINIDRMFDAYGNRQSSPVTWSVYVRRNEVAWFLADGSQDLTIEKKAGEPYSFEVTLLNKGGKQQPYAIENLPLWMSGKDISGTLQPNSSKTLTFQIDPNLTTGEYSLDLYLNTDFNFDEKITLQLRVLQEGPGWEVDPAGFEYTMNIIGKVKIDGVFADDKYTRVAAFAGGKPRGVANLEYDKNYNEYFVYLSVYSNVASGEEITFKIWDAAAGRTLQTFIDGEPSIPYIKNKVIGYKSVPAIFESTGLTEQMLAMKAGWSWVSVYVDDPDLNDLNALTSDLQLEDDDLVKSQTHFDAYDHVNGWNGSLSAAGGLTTKEMVKLKLTHANSLTLTGREVDMAAWKMHIDRGWNWLAYPLGYNVSIHEALALLEAQEGDVIKNQTSFAIYDPVIGWSGTLHYMSAGGGYMLKSGRDQEFTYPRIFNTRSRGLSGRSQVEAPVDMVDNWRSYENNMNVVAEITSEEAFDAVRVIDKNGTLRGKSPIVRVAGRRLSYLTVFGNSTPDQLTFELVNSGGNSVTAQNFTFAPNSVLGSVKDPVRLGGIRNDNYLVYPNPFTEGLYLRIQLEKGSPSEASITLTSLLGSQVYHTQRHLQKGSNPVFISPDIPRGVYFLRIMIDGNAKTWKVIKE